MKKSNKPVLLSGISPSGNLTIGNYIGALKNWVKMQKEYDCLFVLVDMHAITVRQEPQALRSRCLSFIAQYLACGIDPKKSTLFVQSHVKAHTELTWILGCYTYMGELNRMTQFKDKSKKHPTNINAGLYVYPVLMAADILLYQTDIVPIGDDQRQHLEITRDIAIRFNNLYGKAFKIPEPYFPKIGARIMSLLEPAHKMDKSDNNADNYIALLDEPPTIINKIRAAVTDSGTEIKMSEVKPGISNLIAIYSALSEKSLQEIEEAYIDKNYMTFKKNLGEMIVEKLRPIQDEYQRLMKNKDYIYKILKQGAQEATRRAEETLKRVYEKVGFILP